ncbi:MAG: alpha/beta hydrolase [Desulfobacteraceae bacterium]|nr:alpha/beta hydrolase [Desulfobacteraceae bacterium]
MEKPIIINCNNVRLEGLLNQNSSEKGVVVTHPHPLYGGNMDNPVVEQIVQSFFEKGFTTLRFNFRGTGKSSGMFDNGVGELDDVRAVLSYLKESGISQLYLAGYSFGARMNASVVSSGYELQDHIMVSPPMGFMSFDDVESMPSTGLILTGAKDEIAPSDMVQAAINRWQIHTQFEVIKGCDHFYAGCLDKLNQILSGYLL